MGTRGGPLFRELGAEVSRLLWLGPLVEHLPLAYGLGLAGLLVGLSGVALGLRRGERRVESSLVWGPPAVLVASLFAASLPLLDQSTSIGSSLQVPWGGGQAGATLAVLSAVACSLPLLGWGYGQRLLRRRYGAIELTSAECVIHQAGAWSGAARVRPEDLQLKAEDEVMLAEGSGVTCGAAARTQSAIEELQEVLAVQERGLPTPKRPKLFPSLPFAGGVLLLSALTSWRWGVWWIVPSLGIALLVATGLALLWERARRSSRSERLWRQTWGALAVWSTALVLPTLPLESSFTSQDPFSNRVLVTARPGAAAYRVVFISGALSAAESGRIGRREAGPGVIFWSRNSRVAGSSLKSDLGVMWLWCQEPESLDSLCWSIAAREPRPLDTSLRDFAEGRTARTVYFIPVADSSHHLLAYVSEGVVLGLYWRDGPIRLWPSPRPGFSQIDPLPSYQTLRDFCHQSEDDSEGWRTLAPLRARGFRTCESAQIGWRTAGELIDSPWDAKLQPLPSAWGLPHKSPHGSIVRLSLGIRALQSYRDRYPERSPEVTKAIAIAKARREIARREVRVRRQCLAWIERGPGGRSAARSWILLSRGEGWSRRRKLARRRKRKPPPPPSPSPTVDAGPRTR